MELDAPRNASVSILRYDLRRLQLLITVDCYVAFVLLLFSCSRWGFVLLQMSLRSFLVQQTTYRIGNHVLYITGYG